jgi:uncharacterized lipoprotein YajG
MLTFCRGLLILFSSTFFSSCGLRSYTQDMLMIRPTVNTMSKSLNGRTIAVVVSDDRDSNSFGNKIGSYGTGGKIAPANDIVTAVENAMNAALNRTGASLTGSHSGSNLLSVTIRSIKYEGYRGLMYGGVTLTSAINVRLTRGASTIYERRYTATREAAAAHALGGKSKQWNTENVNGVISDVLSKIFADEQLLGLIK